MHVVSTVTMQAASVHATISSTSMQQLSDRDVRSLSPAERRIYEKRKADSPERTSCSPERSEASEPQFQRMSLNKPWWEEALLADVTKVDKSKNLHKVEEKFGRNFRSNGEMREEILVYKSILTTQSSGLGFKA